MDESRRVPGRGPEGESPDDVWARLELTAKLVSEDFDVRIEENEPGAGSEYDPRRRVILLDPVEVWADPRQATWDVAREAARRTLSFNPAEFAEDPQELAERSEQLGYRSLRDYVEDAAAGRWLRRRLPGMEEIADEAYDRRWTGGEEPVVGPEARAVRQQLGYVPRFVQYGQQILRLAHRGELADGLEPELVRAFEHSREDAERTVGRTPDPGRLGSRVDEREAWHAAEERDWRTNEYLWPVVQNLARIDLNNEALQQFLEDMQSRVEEGEESLSETMRDDPESVRQELMDHGRPDQSGRPEESADGGESAESAEGTGNASDGSGEGASPDGDPGSSESSEDVSDPNGNGGSGEAESGGDADTTGTGSSAESAADGTDGSEDGSESAGPAETPAAPEAESTEGRESGERQDGTVDGEGAPDAAGEGEGSTEPQAGVDADGGGDSGQLEASDPLEGLSEEARAALKRLFSDLGPTKQEAYRERARESLETAEDLIEEELSLLSQADPFESHQNRRTRQQSGTRDAGRRTRDAKLLDDLAKRFVESLEPYERVRSEVIGQVDNLYDRLRRLLRPEETDATDYGYPTGQRLDLTRIMPAEHDFEQKRRLFIRETEPGRRDYAFYHILDLSGSMGGRKIIETQKGFIVTAEACDRLMDYNSSELTVRQGFAGFHDDLYRMMALGERLTTSRKDRIAGLPSSISGSTNTLVATQHALQQLLEEPGETANFLLTFSDGMPNHDIRGRLTDLIVGSREEREARRLAMGLIMLGDTGEDQAALDGMLEQYGYDFGLCLPIVGRGGEDGDSAGARKDFSETLADLLETLVEETVSH